MLIKVMSSTMKLVSFALFMVMSSAIKVIAKLIQYSFTFVKGNTDII
jgi:hypothetical protein